VLSIALLWVPTGVAERTWGWAGGTHLGKF
jgi:hypothetical protein